MTYVVPTPVVPRAALARRRRVRVRRAVSALGLLTASGVAVGWSLGAPQDPLTR